MINDIISAALGGLFSIIIAKISPFVYNFIKSRINLYFSRRSTKIKNKKLQISNNEHEVDTANYRYHYNKNGLLYWLPNSWAKLTYSNEDIAKAKLLNRANLFYRKYSVLNPILKESLKNSSYEKRFITKKELDNLILIREYPFNRHDINVWNKKCTRSAFVGLYLNTSISNYQAFKTTNWML